MAEAEHSAADLQLTGIVRSFGAVTALDGVDLTVRAGELLTILGPSGSGKTTLLRTVAGFELPDEGVIRLNQTDITFATPARRQIGMVFQNYALFPHMTVAANVAFPLEMRRTPKAAIGKKVDWALETVNLAGYGERLPRQLSGGQQQRVALARAIVFDPGLLLLDEPFGALDRKLREKMQLEVKRLQRRLGLTSMFVTHDQEEALILSDRIAVMNGGRIEQLGTPQEVYANPVNRFVADFIGESNLFRGRVGLVDDDGATIAREDGGMLRVARSDLTMPGAEIGVLVRPERPRRLDFGETAANIAEGEVVEAVYLGESVKYVLRLADGFNLLVRWPFRAGAAALAPGTRLRVGWDAADMHGVPWS